MRQEARQAREAVTGFVPQSALGMLWAWRFCAYKTELLFSGFSGTNIFITPSWIVDSCSCLATMAALPLLMRVMSARMWRATVVAGALAMSAGTVATSACASTGLASWEQASGLLTGVGSGILYVGCGTCYGRTTSDELETLVPLQMLWVVLASLAAPLLSGTLAGAAFVALFPLACAALVLRQPASARQCRRSDETQGMRTPTRGGVIALLACLVLYKLSTSTAMLSPAAFELTEALGPSSIFYRGVFVVACLALLAVSLTFIASARRYTVASVLRRTTPLSILTVVVITLASNPAAGIVCSIVDAFVGTYVAITYHIWALKLGKYGIMAPHEAFSLFMVVYVGGIALGNVVSVQLVQMHAAAASQVIMGVAVAAAALLLFILPDAERADSTSDEPAPELSEPVASPTTSATPADRMRKLAGAHGLTQRETEVCLLLAQGRSRPYIREKLYISKNTVNSHVAHAYAKLGIHSSQELLDLLERAPGEPR